MKKGRNTKKMTQNLKLKVVKEIEEFGVRITVFENGDTYISTEGDVHVLSARHTFQ